MKILDNSKWNSEIGNSTVVDSGNNTHELEFQDYDPEVLRLKILHRQGIASTSIYASMKYLHKPSYGWKAFQVKNLELHVSS